MAIKKGSKVRQVMPAPIEGTVTGFDVDQEHGTVTYRVEYPGPDGEPTERFFRDGEIEEVAG